MGYREDYFKENKSNNGWYTCTKCGKKLRKGDVDIDHIIPQKHGGSHKLYNLQCLCRYCNRSKQASLKDVPKDLSKNIAKQTKKELSKKIDAVLPTKPKSKTKKTASPTFKLFEKKKTSSKAKKNDKQSTSQKAGISLFGKKDKKYITLSKK